MVASTKKVPNIRALIQIYDVNDTFGIKAEITDAGYVDSYRVDNIDLCLLGRKCIQPIRR